MPAARDEPIRQRTSREQRTVVGAELGALHAGVAHRRDLRLAGIGRKDVSSEVRAGRWSTAGRHTVVIGGGVPMGEALLWRAVWESGSGSVLDGVSALIASGLRHFTTDRIDVAMPANNRSHRVADVRLHRRRFVGPTIETGLPRVRPELATIHAAAWATSDRQAALLVCLPVQQRLIPPARLLETWQLLPRKPRRALLELVIGDVCDGAQSLGELDFARYCRRFGLPEPSRQVVRVLQGGRVYLDVAWEGVGLVVEIDGGHHALALSPVDDALRQNAVVLRGEPVLRIPVLGLRLMPEAFMTQVVEGFHLHRAA